MISVDLTSKRALITGGATGIGKVSAQLLSEAGARVAIADINLEGAQETARECRDGFAVYCDLSSPESIHEMHDKVVAEMGGVDIIFNSGGIISYSKGLKEVELEQWNKVLDVNLRGTHLVCREFIDEMKEQRSGKIINITSLAARAGAYEVGIDYTSAKAGLIGHTKTLAKDAAAFGINVNIVAPGIIATEPVKRQIGDHVETYTKSVPLRRLGEPGDVANAVLFLASSMSDYITGTVLDINGGLFMGA